MGVAGCGKSAVGQALAIALGLPLVEGDDFHPKRNIEKMQQGLALTDHDRAEWLQRLGEQLGLHRGGAVLTCSALKASYRCTLRRASAAHGMPLYGVHLAISQAESLRRVSGRAGHFYPPSLVASQFEALEDPSQEQGVLTLDGTQAIAELAARSVAWLAQQVRTG